MEDDDDVQLSSSTLAALQSFYTERDTRAKHFADLQARAEERAQAAARKPDASGATSADVGAANNDDVDDGDDEGDEDVDVDMDAFAEDWNASQFWYTPGTARALAASLIAAATTVAAASGAAAHQPRIAFVSAPSAFLAARQLLSASSAERSQKPRLTLLEIDTRFGIFGSQFVAYDFNAPTRLPAGMRGAFDAVLVDPPFLSDECQTKAAVTVRWLLRAWDARSVGVVACTGERMEGLMGRLYGRVGVRTTDYVVEHQKGLSNEFRCYANFETGEWKWKA